MPPASPLPVRRAPMVRAARAAGTVLCAVLLTTCSDNPVGPGRPGFGTLRIQPGFDGYARVAPLVVDRVRVIVVRPPDDTVQIINRSFSLSSNQLQIAQPVPLQASSEDFDVTLELYAGSVLMFAGTSAVRVSQSSTTAPQSIPVAYQGPGTQATAISIAPRDTTLSFGAAFPFRASAVDGQQQPVPQFYVSWSLQAPATGVAINPAGTLTVPNRRDTVMVVAVTPNGLRDSTRVFFAAPVSQLVKVGGDGQSALPGARLPLPLAVQVNGSDGLPVPGVSVSFTPPAGGSVDSAVATADAQGIARTGATLAPGAGAQSFTAAAAGAGSVSFNATAQGVQPQPVTLAAGGNHSCEIQGAQTLCWGANTSGMLGDGSTTDRQVATPVVTAQVFASLALGDSHSCALTAAGAAFCWGDNSHGQLGDGSNTSRTAPTAVTGGQSFVRLSAKGNTTCGLTALGQAFCWGENGSGQVGDGTQGDRNAPTAVTGGLSFTALAVGGTHACGLSAAGAAFCWGGNGNGQLGDGTTSGQLQPVAVSGGQTFVAIALGVNSSCAVASGGAGFCWGFNFGLNLTAPTPVAGGFSYTALVMGDNHVCGLTATGWLCGGDNGGGQLGDGTTTDRQVPVAPSGGFVFTELAGGALHSCGRSATGTRCWGTNGGGQLGDGSTTDRLTPALRVGPAASVLVNAGNNQTALPGTQLPVSPSVLVRDGQGAALAGVAVAFTVTGGGGSVSAPLVLTNGAGIAATDWTLGATAGPNTLSATVQSSGVTGNPVTFSATGATAGGVRTWAGTVSNAWTTAANWSPAAVPTTSEDVVIPAGTPNDPVISTAPGAAKSLTLQSGATLTLGPSVLTLSGSLDAQGTITGTTTGLTLSGTGTARGNLTGTNFQILVNGNYSLNGRLVTPGVTINGRLDLAGFTAVVGSSAGDDFQTSNNGVLVMQAATDSLIMNGTNSSMVFDGGSTSGLLTAGVIRVANPAFSTFEQRSTFSAQSFAASGNHKTVFAGAGQLALSMASAASGSGFNDLDVSAAAGGVLLSSGVQVNRELISLPGAAAPLLNGNPAKRALNVGGLRVSGLTLANVQIVANGTVPIAQFDNVTIQNITAGDALTISDAGRVTPYSFNNIAFTSVPAGSYLVANDLNAGDGVPLVINMVNPTPASPSGKVTVTGGAVINWPATPTPVIAWTGAVSSDWSVAGNWNPAQVPTVSDSVTIGTAPNQPALTTTSLVAAVVVGAGGNLTLNGQTLSVTNGLATLAGGLLTMQNPSDILVIGGNAVFDGGNELGLMSAGVITIGGNLTQLATNSPDSYHPSGTHVTALAGAAATVTFATPGLVPGSSHLQEFSWSGGTLTLGSDLLAHGTAIFGPGTVMGNGHRLTVGMLAGTTVTFDHAELAIEQQAPLSFTLPAVGFVNMAPSDTQLTVHHPGVSGTLSLPSFSFSPLTTGATGLYVAAIDFDGIAPALDLSVGTDPGNGPAFTGTQGGATVTWLSTGGSNVWTGAVGSDWNTAGNWSLGRVPTVTDDVLIPAATANSPSLNGSASMHDLSIVPGAVFDVTGGPVTLSGSLDASGGITGSAVVSFTGNGVTAKGTLSGVGIDVAAGAVVSLSGPVAIVAEDVSISGELILGGQVLSTDGGFSTTGAGVLTMTSSSDFLIATQTNFSGGDETGRLTAGVIQTQGFSQSNAGTSAASFFASGGHTVTLGGGATSNVGFTNPGSSRFQELLVTGAVRLQSNVTVAGALSSVAGTGPTSIQAGTPGLTLTTGGALLDSVTFDGVPLVISGGNPVLLLKNLTFQNQIATVTQLTVNHAGQVFPFVFDSLTFLTTPTSGGFYLNATDIDGPSPDVLTIDVTNSTPAAGSPFVQTGNGAVVNWPPAIPAPTWTGAVSSDWFTPGNWSTGAVPLATDSVVIAAAATIPVLTGPVTVQAVNIQGSLNVGGQALTVTGQLRTSGSGLLIMTNPADQITVGGDAIFGGGASLGALTAGVLRVRGNFTQTGNVNAFTATGAHTTILDGTGPQAVSFASSQSRFFDLQVTNTAAPVTIPSGLVVVSDLLSLPAAATLTGAGGVSAGLVNTAPGSTLSVFQLTANSSTLSVGGTFAVNTTTLFGGGAPPNLPYINLNQGGALDQTLAANLTISGTLGTGGNGGWVLNGHTLTAGGLSTTGTGYITMTNPLDTLIVLGDVSFGGGDQTGKLTAGELQVGGNFTQAGAATSFVAGGSHVTRLINADKTVSFAAAFGPAFNDLILDMAGTVNLVNEVSTARDLLLTGGGTMTGSVIRVGRNVSLTAGTFLLPSLVEIKGTLSAPAGSVFSPNVVQYTNPAGGTVPASSGSILYNNLEIGPAGGGGAFTLGGVVTTAGYVNAESEVILAGNVLNVATTFMTIGNGILNMTDPADLVVVGQQTIFSGGDETGKLTAGTLRTAGNFQQLDPGGSPSSFVASGSHTVELVSVSPFGNLIALQNPTTSHFQNLRVFSLAGFNTDVEVRGDLEINFNQAANLFATRVTVGGALTKDGIGFLGIDRLLLSGDLNTIGGTILADTIEFLGTAPQTVTDNIGAGLGKVLVSNDVTWTGGPLNASGDVDITGAAAILRLPNGDMQVGGNLSVTNAGLLALAAPNVVGVTVGGNALFDGGDETGLLDQGRFTFKGNFTQKLTSSTSSFAAGPALEAIFDGNSTIDFADPTKSQFGSVFITLGRTITLASDVRVLDQTRGYNGGFLVGFDGTILGGGTTRWTTASLESAGATFDGVSLIINDPTASVNGFSDLTFKNLSTSATQLTVRHPGATYTLNNITFMPLAVNDTGFYLDLTDSDGSTPARLVVSVNHDPGNGASKTQTDGISSAAWSP